MNKTRPTVWGIEPHTKAKHVILENHLKAWFPIMAGTFGRVVYIDGFAGPGVYSEGEEGSPVIALKTAHEHIQKQNFGEITFFFIEKDNNRVENLKKVLANRFPQREPNLEYHVKNGEFTSIINKALDSLEKNKLSLAPTFAFIDPAGYKHLPITTIARLMSHRRCEVLITFMVDPINRFNTISENILNELFGDDSWKPIKNIQDPAARRKFFLDLYINKLHKIANVKYIRSFEMIRHDGHTAYYLVFGTNHPKGMEVMKDAMFSVDKRGLYSFSDREDPHQTHLSDIENSDLLVSEAAKLVYEKFCGQIVSLTKIKDFVNLETKFPFQKKKILQHLEDTNPPKIKVHKRKIGGFNYPKHCDIEFLKN